ncbi:hypothetical protein LAZ67_11003199 [Cordylochernes scorpioides]|uniref:Uncharacterized protein n=1 Tax=Cordylochernes scorpioides TaxID=51811 RepID=A0ABY6KZP6_9ARAC|nr:hypothetical protein LAZ67_11003199 [Cordylochernes scorpioides]
MTVGECFEVGEVVLPKFGRAASGEESLQQRYWFLLGRVDVSARRMEARTLRETAAAGARDLHETAAAGARALRETAATGARALRETAAAGARALHETAAAGARDWGHEMVFEGGLEQNDEESRDEELLRELVGESKVELELVSSTLWTVVTGAVVVTFMSRGKSVCSRCWRRLLEALTIASLVPEEASRSADQVPERPST